MELDLDVGNAARGQGRLSSELAVERSIGGHSDASHPALLGIKCGNPNIRTQEKDPHLAVGEAILLHARRAVRRVRGAGLGIEIYHRFSRRRLDL